MTILFVRMSQEVIKMTNPKPNQTPSQTIGLNVLNHFGVGVSNLERSIEFYRMRA